MIRTLCQKPHPTCHNLNSRESKVGVGVGVSTAFLTNKGRVLADALVSCACHTDGGDVDEYLLDCSESTMPNLKRHLMMHKLRAKVGNSCNTVGVQKFFFPFSFLSVMD